MGIQRDMILATESGMVDFRWSDTGRIGNSSEEKEVTEMAEKTSLLDCVVGVDVNLLQLIAAMRAVVSWAIRQKPWLYFGYLRENRKREAELPNLGYK